MRFFTSRLGLSALVCFVLLRAGFAGAGVDLDKAAPALTVTELNGTTFDLANQHGHVVIVNVWATWCAPCRQEMPELDAYYRQHRNQGLELIGLSADGPHDRKEVEKVMSAFSYPAALLREAKANGFGSPKSLPTTYIVDADGILRAQLTGTDGPLTEDKLAKIVSPLLTRQNSSP